MARGHFHRRGTSEPWERKSLAQRWWESWWQSQVDPQPETHLILILHLQPAGVGPGGCQAPWPLCLPCSQL